MILEGADGSLSSVASIHVWGDKLECDIFILEGFPEVIGALVVEDVQGRGMSVLF